MDVAIIVAVAENGVIGADGGVPWHYPADLRHFKQETMGHPVIVGRTTFESIVDELGGPLPGRTNIVLSGSDPDLPEDAVVATGIDEALDAAREVGTRTSSETAYVIGGQKVYRQLLPRADRLVLTRIPGEYDGDTYWPGHDDERWTETGRRALSDDLDVLTYRARR